MATEVSIANGALTKLGASTIISLTEESREASLCNNRLQDCLKYVLREHPWNCAIKRVVLAAETTTPAFDWTHQVTLPSDCLRVLWVGPEGVDYRIEGRRIVSDETELWLKYIHLVTDFSLLDSHLAVLVSTYLAFDISYALMQSNTTRDAMYRLYKDFLKHAKTLDAREDPSLLVEANKFIDSRVSGISYASETNRS